MNTQVLHAPLSADARTGLVAWFMAVAGAIRRANERRLAKKSLHALPDHLLEDMGINRFEIDVIVDGKRPMANHDAVSRFEA